MDNRHSRAWNLILDRYGYEIMQELFLGHTISMQARNGMVYEIGIQGRFKGYERIRIWSRTDSKSMCIHVVTDGRYLDEMELPIADRLFIFMERIRVDPEYIEKKANKSPMWRFEDEQLTAKAIMSRTQHERGRVVNAYQSIGARVEIDIE